MVASIVLKTLTTCSCPSAEHVDCRSKRRQCVHRTENFKANGMRPVLDATPARSHSRTRASMSLEMRPIAEDITTSSTIRFARAAINPLKDPVLKLLRYDAVLLVLYFVFFCRMGATKVFNNVYSFFVVVVL